MDPAIKRAIETDADLVMATDPDTDRLGAAVRDNEGSFILLNGNQIMLLCLYYLMTRREELGLLTGKEYTVKTIVTTELVKEIADQKGIEMYDSYTGFKWIAKIIRKNEGVKKYIGGEESYGSGGRLRKGIWMRYLPVPCSRKSPLSRGTTARAYTSYWKIFTWSMATRKRRAFRSFAKEKRGPMRLKR